MLLGGNTVSAIANASGDIPGAALQLIYSTALGEFDFTTFLDALQQVSLLDVQAEPSVTILNNRTADLISGSQVPFVPTAGGGGNLAHGADHGGARADRCHPARHAERDEQPADHDEGRDRELRRDASRPTAR